MLYKNNKRKDRKIYKNGNTDNKEQDNKQKAKIKANRKKRKCYVGRIK